MCYIESVKDLEEFIKDERERPSDYQTHTYPCYIEYSEPWDMHFCGSYYFLNYTPIEAMQIRISYLQNRVNKMQENINKITRMLNGEED